ncbi:uncharacterized protein LOC113792119 isoform X1 [Dermatophagoides pteronyssinus]|uniref:uncharacterized protein LOC113792119 isoform X1 n=1 Tax=Dermatophagoides pteronyssinus TaxID=6956 RepID=UPI003F67DAB1
MANMMELSNNAGNDKTTLFDTNQMFTTEQPIIDSKELNIFFNRNDEYNNSTSSKALLLSRAIWLALKKENIFLGNNTETIANDIATTLLEEIADGINQTFVNQTSLSTKGDDFPLPIITSRIAAIANKQTTQSSSSSSTTATTEDEDFYRHLITVIAYSLIIIVSLCGNSLVLKMILTKKKLQTTTNILIAWLAVSDLLTTTLNIPFNVARFIFMNYPFPSLFCKLVPFIQVMCVYVSTFTMGVIALHRYMTVTSATSTTTTRSSMGGSGAGTSSSNTIFYHPLLLHGSFCLCIIMTIVWFLAGLLATPHSMFNQIVYVPYQNRTYIRCRAEYPQVDFNLRLTLSVEAFLTQYLIPLGLICVLYIKIGLVVAKQGRFAQKANSQRRMEQDSARRRRLAMVSLILIVAMFGICWMPLNLYHLLVDFHLIIANFNIFLICHWIAMSSVCWNPFIYCWLNESFRKGATKMIIFICCCCCPRIRRQFLLKRNINEFVPSVGGSGVGGVITGGCVVTIGIASSSSPINTLTTATATTTTQNRQTNQQNQTIKNDHSGNVNKQNNSINDHPDTSGCQLSSVNNNNNQNDQNPNDNNGNRTRKIHRRKFHKLRSISLRNKNPAKSIATTTTTAVAVMNVNSNNNRMKYKYKKNASATAVKINGPTENQCHYNDDQTEINNNNILGCKHENVNDVKKRSKHQNQSSTLQLDSRPRSYVNNNNDEEIINENNNSSNGNDDSVTNQIVPAKTTTTIKTTYV